MKIHDTSVENFSNKQLFKMTIRDEALRRGDRNQISIAGWGLRIFNITTNR